MIIFTSIFSRLFAQLCQNGGRRWLEEIFTRPYFFFFAVPFCKLHEFKNVIWLWFHSRKCPSSKEEKTAVGWVWVKKNKALKIMMSENWVIMAHFWMKLMIFWEQGLTFYWFFDVFCNLWIGTTWKWTKYILRLQEGIKPALLNQMTFNNSIRRYSTRQNSF